jgi:hypothetical protein
MEKPDTLELYRIATAMKKEGKDDYAIEQELLLKGLDQDEARKVIARANVTTLAATGQGEEKGNGAWGWLIWVGALGLFNLLSYLFDWSFWIY